MYHSRIFTPLTSNIDVMISVGTPSIRTRHAFDVTWAISVPNSTIPHCLGDLRPPEAMHSDSDNTLRLNFARQLQFRTDNFHHILCLFCAIQHARVRDFNYKFIKRDSEKAFLLSRDICASSNCSEHQWRLWIIRYNFPYSCWTRRRYV